MRVESDLAQMLYVASDESSVRFGFVGWADQVPLEVTTSIPAHMVAVHNRQLILLNRDEARVLDLEGNVTKRIRSSDDFHYVDLETVSDANGDGFLVLVSSALDGRLLTRFTLVAL